MPRTPDKNKPVLSSATKLTWADSLGYIVSVFAIGLPVSVFVAWAIGEIFFTDDPRASLPELFLLVMTYFGFGVLIAPSLPVVLISFLLAVRAKRYGNLKRAKFWRRTTWISALVTPFLFLLIYVLINGWEYDASSWDFLLPVTAIAATVFSTISMIVGLAIRSLIAKLFHLVRVRPAIEASTSN